MGEPEETRPDLTMIEGGKPPYAPNDDHQPELQVVDEDGTLRTPRKVVENALFEQAFDPLLQEPAFTVITEDDVPKPVPDPSELRVVPPQITAPPKSPEK